MPTIPLLHNTGNYVCSLGQVVRWLGSQAEQLGVDIFPGTPAAEVLYSSTTSKDAHVIGAILRHDGAISHVLDTIAAPLACAHCQS